MDCTKELVMTKPSKKDVIQLKKVNPNNHPLMEDCSPAMAPLSWFYFVVPPIVLSLLTLIFYWPSRGYEFQFDDIANIVKHYGIRHHTFNDLFSLVHDG